MTTTLTHLTFDCADAAALAGFWAAVLDQPVDDGASPEYALVKGTPGWMFLQVPEPKAAKNRMHPDLTTDDLPAEVARLQGPRRHPPRRPHRGRHHVGHARRPRGQRVRRRRRLILKVLASCRAPWTGSLGPRGPSQVARRKCQRDVTGCDCSAVATHVRTTTSAIPATAISVNSGTATFRIGSTSSKSGTGSPALAFSGPSGQFPRPTWISTTREVDQRIGT